MHITCYLEIIGIKFTLRKKIHSIAYRGRSFQIGGSIKFATPLFQSNSSHSSDCEHPDIAIALL